MIRLQAAEETLAGLPVEETAAARVTLLHKEAQAEPVKPAPEGPGEWEAVAEPAEVEARQGPAEMGAEAALRELEETGAQEARVEPAEGEERRGPVAQYPRNG